MGKKVKKVASTLYLSEEINQYIHDCCKITLRKPSQEIEYMIRTLRDIRQKNDLKATSGHNNQSQMIQPSLE